MGGYTGDPNHPLHQRERLMNLLWHYQEAVLHHCAHLPQPSLAPALHQMIQGPLREWFTKLQSMETKFQKSYYHWPPDYVFWPHRWGRHGQASNWTCKRTNVHYCRLESSLTWMNSKSSHMQWHYWTQNCQRDERACSPEYEFASALVRGRAYHKLTNKDESWHTYNWWHHDWRRKWNSWRPIHNIS